MPRITDKEPITDGRGKILFDNELDRVKKMYGFLPATPINMDLEPEERYKRQSARIKSKINKAK